MRNEAPAQWVERYDAGFAADRERPSGLSGTDVDYGVSFGPSKRALILSSNQQSWKKCIDHFGCQWHILGQVD